MTRAAPSGEGLTVGGGMFTTRQMEKHGLCRVFVRRMGAPCRGGNTVMKYQGLVVTCLFTGTVYFLSGPHLLQMGVRRYIKNCEGGTE